MGDFNWRGAFAGLLGEAGRQMNNQASRMQEMEEKRLYLEMQQRAEEAKMLKEKAMEKWGYDAKGRPWTRGEYEATPEDQRPDLYDKPPEREKPEEPHKYSSDWGKNYADRKAAGASEEEARKYADEATAKTPTQEKSPYAGKLFWDKETGQPIPQEEYWKKSPDQRPNVTDKPPGDEKNEPQVSEAKARAEIVSIKEKIAKLKSGNILGAEEMNALAESSPALAGILAMSGGNKQMNEEDRANLISALEEHMQWLQQFVGGGKPTGNGILASKPQTDDVSAFIDQTLTNRP